MLYTLMNMPMHEHIQHNKDERTQFFRKIYLSLYWKGCVWEVSWRHIVPPILLAVTAFFPVFLSCSTGAWGPSLCMVLIPASSLQLIWTSWRRVYIIIWHPPTSCERHNSHSVQPLDRSPSDIFDWMHLLFTQVHFFFSQLGRGQYVTHIF